jgi:hypothetical protein
MVFFVPPFFGGRAGSFAGEDRMVMDGSGSGKFAAVYHPGRWFVMINYPSI